MEPTGWRAPQVLLDAGLAARLSPARVVQLNCPRYSFESQVGTQIRNGLAIREHALVLADAVKAAQTAGRFPLVLSGDSSILLGCLLGARRGGACGLVHVDG